MATTGRCDIRVILLCKGPGADANSYRPNRDDSQWWGRRDALVRCVSSFLFGPSTPHDGGSRELIFLFDDDLAKMSMKISSSKKKTSKVVVPTEHYLVSLWKRAAQNLNTEIIESNGIKVRIDFDPTYDVATGGKRGASSSSSTTGGGLPTGLDSKRQVLEYLQNHCPMEFLRTKGLNSNPDVILRKTNKKALTAVFAEWKKKSSAEKQQQQNQSRLQDDRIESIYSDLLKMDGDEEDSRTESPKQQQQQSQMIAGTLHEMYEEFPCFDIHKNHQQQATSNNNNNNNNLKLCLFLGAVRDMTTKEHKMLQKVCSTAKIPLLGIRFGTVPEFTSKILSVLAYHHSQKNIIVIAIRRLLESKTGQRLGRRKELSWKPQTHNLTVVCTVPLKSTKISTELKDRCRVHWSLVRIIVCTLWRSKLVGGTAADVATTMSNSLYLIFDDGITTNLEENEFVANLANKHQAAPCEYQILTALIEKINGESSSSSDGTTDWSKRKVASNVFKTIIGSESSSSSSSRQKIAATFVVGIDSQASNDISQNFYWKEESQRTTSRNVVVLLDIIGGKRGGEDAAAKPSKIYRALIRHVTEKLKIPFWNQSLIIGDSYCQDYEAATIVALQHFCYQNRMFIESSSSSSSAEHKSILKRKRST